MEQSTKHIGETRGVADHDHDMVHELSKRLDAVWRFDQYIANAKNHDELREFWTKLKDQEEKNVVELKNLIRKHIELNCF